MSRVFFWGLVSFWDAVKDGGAAQRCDYGLEKRAWLDDCTFSAECRSSLYHLFCLFLRFLSSVSFSELLERNAREAKIDISGVWR